MPRTLDFVGQVVSNRCESVWEEQESIPKRESVDDKGWMSIVLNPASSLSSQARRLKVNQLHDALTNISNSPMNVAKI